MAYVYPIHRPSSVRHATKLRFLSPDEECLVVAKSNRIEIYDQTQEGLILRHSRSIYGKITMLQRLLPADATTDHLFIGTDRHAYFTVSWDAEHKQLKTEHVFLDQAIKEGRDSQIQDRCVVDPHERFMALELFEGILTVIPLKRRTRKKHDPEIKELGAPILVRVTEMFVRSAVFLYPREDIPEKAPPKMAVLYEDNQHKPRLKVKTLEYSQGSSSEPGTADFLDDDDVLDEVDVSSSHVIPVPAPIHGFIVLAETRITYIDETKETDPKTEHLDEPTIFISWEAVDDNRWLLADDFGRLYFLMLVLSEDGENVESFKLDLLGNTSRASVLTYLGGGAVFLGSHVGDSQVASIQPTGVEIIQTLPNIAPILDFTVMDMGSRSGGDTTNEYSSGQARIVTGSGAFQDGSLRSVRSGVGLEDLGSLGEIDNVTGMFSIQSPGSRLSDALLLSFIDETRVFQFAADGNVEEVDEFQGFDLAQGTLLATNIASMQNLAVQCTTSVVRLVDLESGMVVNHWSPEDTGSIVAAAANDQYIGLSISGTEVVILDLTAELQIVGRKSFGANIQISCIDLPKAAPSACVVGFWQSSEIAILKIEGLEPIHSTKVSEDSNAVPRSVLLCQVLPDQPPSLFVAMADGNVVTYNVDVSTFSLSGRKSTILGTQQASLKALSRGDGLYNVFAICEHPSLIYGSEGRIVYSAVTAENATCICAFDSEAFPDAIVLAASGEVKISLVDTERTTHIQTLPIRETVRRIAYSSDLKAFGLGTIQRSLIDGVEVVQSHFKLADEVVFKELDTYELNEDELIESVIRADLREGSREVVERFVVGTAYIEDERAEAVRGRIIIFEVTSERKLKVVLEHAVKGACRALATLDGKIVAALVRTVNIYGWDTDGLTRLSSYRTSTAPIDICVTGSYIAIADVMKSVSIVKHKPGDSGEQDKLLEVARHFQIGWSTSVASIDENTYLVSDAEGNLMVLKQNVNGVTADDKRRLEPTSELQLGEMVNKIRSIHVPVSSDATVIPRAFMATVEGSIYVFAIIAPSKQDFLMTLQTSVARLIKSTGNIDFLQYRGFRNSVRQSQDPYRFVDGELVEKFLDLELADQHSVVRDLGGDWDVEKVRGVIEELRRLC